MDFFAFKACLVYIESSRTAGVIYRDPLLKTKNNKTVLIHHIATSHCLAFSDLSQLFTVGLRVRIQEKSESSLYFSRQGVSL